MGAVASQITSLSIVYSIVYSKRRSKKTPKLRVTGLCAGNHRSSVNSPHKGTVTRKMFPFDDVVMTICSWSKLSRYFGYRQVHAISNHQASPKHRMFLRVGGVWIRRSTCSNIYLLTTYTPLWKSNRNVFSESNLIEIIRYQYIVFGMY